jgi:serine/threonine-protein kinase
MPPITDPGGPLPSTVISHALRVLTCHMGPIARIVVKRAAVQARSTPEFYALLADEVAEGMDKRRLLRQLHAIGE